MHTYSAMILSNWAYNAAIFAYSTNNLRHCCSKSCDLVVLLEKPISTVSSIQLSASGKLTVEISSRRFSLAQKFPFSLTHITFVCRVE